MKSFILLAFLVGAVFAAAIDDNNSLNGEGDIGSNDDLFTNITKSTDTETVVEIRDENGGLVAETDIFLHEGFQIEKPTDREVCLLQSISDNSTCYEETPVTSKIPDEIWDHCEGREVLVHSPIDCDEETEKDGTLEGNSPSGLRKKRASMYCIYITIRRTECASYTKCCKWIFCSRCCARYRVITVRVRKCYYRG